MSDNGGHTFDYPVRDDASQYQRLPADENAVHFEDHNGLFLWAKAGEVDLFFGGTIYHVGGSKWGFEDGALNQTFLLVTPNGKNDRTMAANDFVSNRMDSIRTFGFEETVHDDRVVWRAGNRELVSSAPTWELTGEHFGVDVDLKFTADGAPDYFSGNWAGLPRRRIGGNEVLCRGKGSCTYDGKTYTVENGFGVRERVCLGRDFDVPTLLGSTGGYLWTWVFTEKLKVFYFNRGGHHAGTVFLGDSTIQFTGEQTTADVLEQWTDPLTHETQATRMLVRMKSADGDLEVEIHTWRRFIFGFHLIGGYTTHTGKTGRASGTFTSPDGRVIPIDDELCYLEHGFATPIVAD